MLSDEHVVQFLLLFDRLEVVNDDTDEQVDDELTANYHEDDEEQDGDPLVSLLTLGL